MVACVRMLIMPTLYYDQIPVDIGIIKGNKIKDSFGEILTIRSSPGVNICKIIRGVSAGMDPLLQEGW